MSERQTLPDSPPAPSDPQDTDFVAIKVSEPPTGESHDPLSSGVDGPGTNRRALCGLRAMASKLLRKLFILKLCSLIFGNTLGSYILKNIILHDSSAAWIRDHQWVVFIPFFNSYLVFRPFYEQGNQYHLIDYLFSAIAFESGCFGLVVAYPDNPIVEIVSIIVGQPFVVTALVLVWAFVPSVRVLPTVMDVDHLARVWPINGQNISTGSQIPTNDSANKPSSGSADSSSTNNDQITILMQLIFVLIMELSIFKDCFTLVAHVPGMFIAVYLPLYWAAWIQGHRWVVFIPFLVLFASFYIVYRRGGRPLVVYVFTTIALASGYSGLIVSYPDDTTMSSVGGTILGVFLGLTFLTNTLVISFRNRDKTEWMLSFLQSIQRMVEIKIPIK